MTQKNKTYATIDCPDELPLPEYIAGIPTDKNCVAQRRKLVTDAYKQLLSDLMNKTNKKVVHNNFLNVDVYLIMHEGGKEATNRAAFNWQSAYAILKLEKIIRKATAVAGEPIYIPAKDTGNQKAHKYVNMAVLYYDFIDLEKWYMNFRIRLVLGVKSDGRHIQYSVNKIDIV
jgi:hypothetical protein